MSDEPTSPPPAGWYPDGSGRERYWDGQQWTEHFADEYGEKFGKQLAEGAAVPGHALKTARPGGSAAAAKPSDPNVLWEAVGQPLTGIGAGRYRLTADFLYFEKGALTTRAQQIATHEIHDVDVNQSLTQKARGVGNITLHAIRTTGSELVIIEDVASFREGVRIINETALEARRALKVKDNTQTINYTGQVPVVPQATAAAEPDIASQLLKLADLRSAGVLTDEEFAAAKQRLLGIG